MAKAKFDLGSTLADVLGNVSETDTRDYIEYIPLTKLVSDERNFYSVDGVEELAANIELVGLQQPLRVLRGDGEDPFFVIVSGHRRAAALRILAEENPERWKMVPCIVERPAASPEMEELRLIYANADTRRMTSADQAKQAERVSELLYALKEQGVEFPGRMRDHVAEICKINATKLAELKVIRGKLSEDWAELWNSGEISHACAYKLAQQPEEVQRQIYISTETKHMTEWRVDGYARTIGKLLHRNCQVSKPGECLYAKTLISIELGPGYHGCSNYRCCKECPNLTTCKDSCPNVIDVKTARKAEQKARRAEELKTEKARTAELVGITRKIWTRFGELRRSKGLSAEDCCKARGDSFIRSYHGEDWYEEMEGPKAKITEHTAVPWTNSMQADDVEKLVKTADAFGVSCDYLLGRTDELRPWRSEWISVDDHYPAEGDFVLAVTRYGAIVPAVYFRARFMDSTEKSTGNVPVNYVEYWMPRPKLPEGRKWTGQETIEDIVGRARR